MGASAALVTLAVKSVAAAPPGSDSEFMRSAALAVETAEREDGFSGVILVARGDKVLLRKAAGFADRERGIRNTPETRFPIESISKQFTAAAIMLLVEEGKVALDDPVSKFYPASPATWHNVTIKHLLTHSSGIEDYWVHRQMPPSPAPFRTREDWFRSVRDDPLAFNPGTSFEYSNAGYVLLGRVIEQASGGRYEDFLRARIFNPMGMRHTTYGTIRGETVAGYQRSADGGWRQASSKGAVDPAGAGGIYSSLDDMLIWSRALERGKILSAQSRVAMFTDYGFNYGFGWRFAPKFGRQMIWHTGNDSDAAIFAIFDRFPGDEVALVVMTNNNAATSSTARLLIEGRITAFPASAARKLVEQVERLFFGREP